MKLEASVNGWSTWKSVPSEQFDENSHNPPVVGGLDSEISARGTKVVLHKTSCLGSGWMAEDPSGRGAQKT